MLRVLNLILLSILRNRNLFNGISKYILEKSDNVMKSDYLIGCLENLKSLHDSIQTIMFRIYYVNISEDVSNIYEDIWKIVYTEKMDNDAVFDINKLEDCSVSDSGDTVNNLEKRLIKVFGDDDYIKKISNKKLLVFEKGLKNKYEDVKDKIKGTIQEYFYDKE